MFTYPLVLVKCYLVKYSKKPTQPRLRGRKEITLEGLKDLSQTKGQEVGTTKQLGTKATSNCPLLLTLLPNDLSSHDTSASLFSSLFPFPFLK